MIMPRLRPALPDQKGKIQGHIEQSQLRKAGLPSHMSHSQPFSGLGLRFRLPHLAHGDQHLLNLLMQAGQHIDTHRHAGD